jgi:hypothetical protein
MENKVISREYVEENYVHKDVIRKKIKYIKSYYSQINGDYFMMNNVIQVLEELLENK